MNPTSVLLFALFMIASLMGQALSQKSHGLHGSQRNEGKFNSHRNADYDDHILRRRAPSLYEE